MDSSSQIIGGSEEEEEECHSSESGWTMYIGSPVDEEVDEYDDQDDQQLHAQQIFPMINGATNDDSDDSMVSDASSGMPANHSKQQGKEKDDQRKISNKKGKKIMATDHKKNGYEDKNVKRGETSQLHVVPAQSGNKLRRYWLGKKK